MKLALYIKDKSLASDPRLAAMKEALEKASCDLFEIETPEDLAGGADALLSIGGDGTFLSAAKRIGDSGIPVLGVNLGRLGFLSENRPEDVPASLLEGRYTLEDRALLKTEISGLDVSGIEGFSPYALNEISVHRSGAAMLGVNVSLNGEQLPTVWADGMLVATSSGSTAYSLSVGGPICSPDSRVLIIAPIAPHNLNVRPLIVPDTTEVGVSWQSRDDKVMVTMDNRTLSAGRDAVLRISMARFSLKRIRLEKSNFINALESKLFWGEDMRNKP
ncbi:MAG: NAD(+)/NADH kinase [Bacteroidales bacterium]|nr:NAD(+)/NADH kinase [Bacteroidales bacterium]